MTVQELVTKLQELPPDAEVLTVWTRPDNELVDRDAHLRISLEGAIFIVPDDDYINHWVG